jgi:chromosome partitioning protein
VKTLAFFNPKAGVGKTTLVYHLAHMYADLGVRTLVVDLDPQADLSCLFLTDEQLESLWPGGATPKTVAGALEPLLIDETTDLPEPPTVTITPRLGLLPGDLALTLAEDELNSHWTQCLDDPARSLLVEAAVWRLVEEAATTWGARLVLVDLGPNLTALNRAALLAAQYVAVPLACVPSARPWHAGAPSGSSAKASARSPPSRCQAASCTLSATSSSSTQRGGDSLSAIATAG